MTDLHFITALIYALSTTMAWAALRTQPQSGPSAGPRPNDVLGKFALGALWVGLLVHAVALFHALLGVDAAGNRTGINVGFSHAVSLLVWLTLASYVLLGRDARLTRLALLYLVPVAITAALLTLALPAQRIVSYEAAWAFRLHFVVAILAYALFTVAALHAALMLFLSHRLHEGSLSESDAPLPPLMRVERLLFQLLTAAFVLLTATLLSGVLFSEILFGKAFQFNSKVVFSFFSWAIVGSLLFGHWRYGWRGRVAVRWTLIGFVLLLAAYVGSKFVLEVLLVNR